MIEAAPEPVVDRIAAVEAATVDVRLAAPITLGEMTIRSREFVFLRVVTEGGLQGKSYVLTRGQPLDVIVARQLAPRAIGRDPEQIAGCVSACDAAVGPTLRVGAHTRAVSLVEIALWDIKAQRAKMPLWRLLGGERKRVPALVVADYLADDAPVEPLLERIASLGREGCSAIKLARSPRPEVTARLIRQSRAVLPDDCGIVVDAAWAWPDAAAAHAELGEWGSTALEWLEDPFDPRDIGAAKTLYDSVEMPIAYGDEVTDASHLRNLMRTGVVDVVRIDATTLGGITAARDLGLAAREAGLRVSPHLYPEIHVHCAAAWSEFEQVELFDSDSGAFPVREFLYGGPSYAHGSLEAPEAPGLGFDVDWEKLRSAAGKGHD